jgi:DNA-binding HxlR family transcriptional regulator
MSSDKTARPGAYPLAKPHPLADCPLHAAFVAVGGKWKLTILYWLAREPHHFSGLLRRVAPISHKVLTEQLRELEADGLVERQVTGPVPEPVLYRLGRYGETVLPLVEEARVWGLAHLARMRGPDFLPSPAALGCGDAIEHGVRGDDGRSNSAHK